MIDQTQVEIDDNNCQHGIIDRKTGLCAACGEDPNESGVHDILAAEQGYGDEDWYEGLD